MTVQELTQRARAALDLNRLSGVLGVRIVRLDAEDYTDSDGEPSLRVLVVLDEAVDVDKLSGTAVGHLKAAIRQNLRERGIPVFPYIFLAKQSELDDTDED